MAGSFGSGQDVRRGTNIPSITSFSVAWWYKYTNAASYEVCFSYDNAQAAMGDWMQFGQDSGGIYYSSDSVGGLALTGGASTNWRFFCLVRNGSTTNATTIYNAIQGNALNVQTQSNDVAAMTSPSVYISTSGFGEQAVGLASNVWLFDRPITAQEATHLYQYGVPANYAGVNSWLPMSGVPLGRSVYGLGGNWTVTGSPTVTAAAPQQAPAGYGLGSNIIAGASAAQAAAVSDGGMTAADRLRRNTLLRM